MPSRESRRLRARPEGSFVQTLEKRKESHPALYIFSVVILVVIVVTFIGSPVAGRISGAGTIVFGRYDGREIAYYPGSFFDLERQAIARQLQSSGSSSQNVEADIYSVWYQAFQATALHVAVLEQAGKAALEVSDSLLDRDLTHYAAYVDEQGNFSEQKYNQTSVSERVATRKIERERLLSNQYFTDVASEAKTGSNEQAFITEMASDQRRFEFVSFPFSSFPDAEVKAYGEANRSRFVKIKVSVITITSSEGDAGEIRKKISANPSSFAELAKSYSKDSYASAGGDMGWRYAYELEQELEKKEQASTLLALKAGDVSAVLKGVSGWTIWRCDGEAVQPDFSDTATVSAVRSYLDRYERGKVEDWFVERAGKLARRAAEAGFATAAKEAGVAVNTTEYFPINLQGVFVLSPVKALPESATPYSAIYSEDFFYRAFSLGADQASSQPIVLDDQVVVLRLLGKQTIPLSQLALMDRMVGSIASQSLQVDLQQQLLNPTHLQSDFDAVFTRQILPPQRG